MDQDIIKVVISKIAKNPWTFVLGTGAASIHLYGTFIYLQSLSRELVQQALDTKKLAEFNTQVSEVIKPTIKEADIKRVMDEYNLDLPANRDVAAKIIAYEKLDHLAREHKIKQELLKFEYLQQKRVLLHGKSKSDE